MYNCAMKTHIDLLPPWAKKAKARRKHIIILAVVQIAVIFALSGTALLLHTLEQRAWAHARELSERVAAFAPAPAELAEALQAARVEAVYIEQFLENVPGYMDISPVEKILEATPVGATLLRVDYTGQDFLLIGTTDDINIIETHRTNLSQFFYVTPGRITRTDETYTYEIRVRDKFN